MNNIRLYLDENVHKKVATALRLRGYDVTSAHEAKNWGLSDKEQLEFAAGQKRAIFTFNVRDYIILHKQYLKHNKKHYGIIISRQLTLTETINRLSFLLLRYNPEMLINQLIWL